jgi:hypothetical protein
MKTMQTFLVVVGTNCSFLPFPSLSRYINTLRKVDLIFVFLSLAPHCSRPCCLPLLFVKLCFCLSTVDMMMMMFSVYVCVKGDICQFIEREKNLDFFGK